jgi:ferredoxin
MLALNAELAAQWPVITTQKTPLPDHEHWAAQSGKLPLLER